MDGASFPAGESPMEATEYTVEEMAELLREWGMVPCEDYDEDRVRHDPIVPVSSKN